MAMLMTLGVVFLTIFKTIEPASDAPAAETPGPFSHELLDQVQHQYVDDNGRVDYSGLRAEPEKLDTYYKLVATYSPDSHPELFPSEHERLALLDQRLQRRNADGRALRVPDHQRQRCQSSPSPLFAPDKSGFFYFRKLVFGGESYNLYDLEKDVIRGRFPEPRIRFAINCASNGCPRLPRRAFTGDRLEQQLETEARRFINEPRNLRFDHDRQVLHLSSIFTWYEEDYLAWYRERYLEADASLMNLPAPVPGGGSPRRPGSSGRLRDQGLAV